VRSSPSGARTTTKSGHTERLAESLRLRLLQSIATQTQPPTQDQLTCNPLGLSPTDWYGWRGQVIGTIDLIAEILNQVYAQSNVKFHSA
jgi:hypothetical protein